MAEQIDRQRRQLNRQFGYLAFKDYKAANGKDATLVEALGSLIADRMAAARNNDAQVFAMAAAIDWLMAMTGMSFDVVIAEITRRADIKVREAAQAGVKQLLNARL